MPAVTTRGSKKATASVAAKKAVKKTKNEEVDDEAIHEVEEVAVAKKSRAKATAKSVSSKNPKKRAREESSDSEEDEDAVSTPATVPAKASAARASGTKKSAGKKSTSAKKSASASSDSEEDGDSSFEEAPAKKSATKRAAAKKASPASKKADLDDEESGSEDGAGEEPTLAIVPTDFSLPKLAAGELKIVSWNVASYRAALKKGLLEYLKGEDADIVCLQETKIPTEKETQKHGYHAYFFGCQAKPGLHGTGLLTKVKPISVDMVSTLDDEGRVIVAEYDKFYLINTYVPNSGQKLERLSYRMKWDQGLQDLMLKLEKTKPIIWTGDLNVAKHPIDLANPAGNKRTAGFTEQERNSFLTFTEGNNIIDTYRTRNPDEKDCYTFWTYKRNSRAKNIGWRMDYFMVSASLDASITQSYRRNHILGSDHCPIVIHLRK